MKRARDMAGRLPRLYREGTLVEGFLEQPAQQIEIALEDALEVQRAHFFNDGLELEETAKLAALLSFVPEPWQTLRLFRAWVHSQRDAVLQGGAVTEQGIRGFAESYAAAYQQATGVQFSAGKPALIENPLRRKFGRPDIMDDTVPLTRFTVEMQGLDEAFASFLLIGLPAAPESMPLVANLHTGEALLFRGNVEAGKRLWLRAATDGSMTAQLEGRDVTSKLVSVTDLNPGTPWQAPHIQSPAHAIRLLRGENTLWFLPVAHYDELGLDRFLLALADLALAQGRWDNAKLDHALFYQDPAVRLKVTWVEAEPASIQLRVPAQIVRRRVPSPGSAEQDRDQLGLALTEGVQRLKAAGVRSEVVLLEFSEIQGTSEFLTGVLPLRLKEAGATGAERMPEAGGLFDVTDYGDSTFR